MKRILKAAQAALFGALLLAGCSQAVDHLPTTVGLAPSSPTAQAVIRVGGTGADLSRSQEGGLPVNRTLMPTPLIEGEVSRYVITLTGATTIVYGDDSGEDTAAITEAGVAFVLDTGNWTVTVEAFRTVDPDGTGESLAREYKTAKGTASLLVTASGPNTVAVTLDPIAIAEAGGVNGVFSWNLTLPGEVALTTVSLGEEAVAPLEAVGSLEKAPGVYGLFIVLTKEGTGQTAGVYERVYIYPGLTTEAVYDFTSGGYALTFAEEVLVAGSLSITREGPGEDQVAYTVRAYSDEGCTQVIEGASAVIEATAVTNGSVPWLLGIPSAAYTVLSPKTVYLRAEHTAGEYPVESRPVTPISEIGPQGNADAGVSIRIAWGFTTVPEMQAWLETHGANTSETPYPVKLWGINIPDTWGALNTAVQDEDKYVALNLSYCTAARDTVTGQASPTGNDMNIIKDNEYIKSIVLPSTLTSIGEYAFAGCDELTSVTIPASVTSIGSQVFADTSSLTAIVVEEDNPVYSSQDGVLYNKNKTSLIQYPGGKTGEFTIPNTVTTIGEYAFAGCDGLTSVTIPNTVASIGEYAFAGCDGLTAVTIPASVTSIGDSAFSDCSGLTSVTFIAGSNMTSGTFSDSDSFPGDLQKKYLAAYSGAGMYTRKSGEDTWTKQMGYIQPGSFQMGDPLEEVHTVNISTGFYMSTHEVTQAEFAAVMGQLPDSLLTSDYGQGDNYPVYYVNWYDAIAYCNKLSIAEHLTPAYEVTGVDFSTLPYSQIPTSSSSTWDAATCNWTTTGYRLPTEAEWEYACRAGTDGYWYMGGSGGSLNFEDLQAAEWFYNTATDGKSHPVGEKTANKWDLHDMCGNVSEWCWDWQGSYSDQTETDPRGAPGGNHRVYRGGNFLDSNWSSLMSAYRSGADPRARTELDGFRVVRP